MSYSGLEFQFSWSFSLWWCLLHKFQTFPKNSWNGRFYSDYYYKIKFYKTTIISAVNVKLYGCKMWYVYHWRINTKYGCLRIMFTLRYLALKDMKRRTLHNSELYALYASNDIIIQSRRLPRAANVARIWGYRERRI